MYINNHTNKYTLNEAIYQKNVLAFKFTLPSVPLILRYCCSHLHQSSVAVAQLCRWHRLPSTPFRANVRENWSPHRSLYNRFRLHQWCVQLDRYRRHHTAKGITILGCLNAGNNKLSKSIVGHSNCLLNCRSLNLSARSWCVFIENILFNSRGVRVYVFKRKEFFLIQMEVFIESVLISILRTMMRLAS